MKLFHPVWNYSNVYSYWITLKGYSWIKQARKYFSSKRNINFYLLISFPHPCDNRARTNYHNLKSLVTFTHALSQIQPLKVVWDGEPQCFRPLGFEGRPASQVANVLIKLLNCLSCLNLRRPSKYHLVRPTLIHPVVNMYTTMLVYNSVA